ncbi:MAG: fumarylacetoacetate hydrolase family protein [Rubrivivax sp.]|nr:fumarylacetoacetate hydrolase family protein [Rubrivivax sp.]
MTPQQLLQHIDSGQLWPAGAGEAIHHVGAAYRTALAVRALRVARGERPVGYKVGFTNRSIWPRYQVFAPIWGPVWHSTLSFARDGGTVSLAQACQPRIEPEVVFAFKSTPPPGATLDQLFDALDWLAPGFEIVQCHLPDWKFCAAQTVADSGLHAHLRVGEALRVADLAGDANNLHRLLSGARVALARHGQTVEEGSGQMVLDSPLLALQHFVSELRACPGAPDIRAGDLVTTGTWTDAWPVQAGQRWSASYTSGLGSLSVDFS